MDWELSHEFVQRWFGLNDDQVVLCGKGTNLISISALNLSTRLTAGKADGLVSLSAALDDIVMVYPWLKPANETAKRQMIHDVHLGYTWRHPGYWVDLPARVTEESVQVLVDHLSLVGLTPTMLTGIRHIERDYVRGGRLWWRFDALDDTDTDTFLIQQRHWQWFIQASAIECGAFDYVSIRDPGFITMLQTPLPGTIFQGDQVTMLPYRAIEDLIDHRSVEWHRDANSYLTEFEESKAEVDALMEGISTMSYVARGRFDSRFMTWDDILGPHGWRVYVTSTDTGLPVTWWTAPGTHGPIAFTRDDTLRLYDGTWLSGLKELSDYGFVLDRITVGCLLWWDGDVDAMIADIESGKRLFPTTEERT